MRPRLAIVVLALVVAGCSGGDSPAIPEEALPRLVLQPADLPEPFERFDEGRLASADEPKGVAGWKSRYRRSGDARTRGALVVESRIDLFESAADAEDELAVIASDEGLEATNRGLGDEAVVVAKTQAGFPRRLATFLVAWRTANALATVTVNGFQGRVGEADALRLARKQQARIAAAS
jgi:hypothetical protein